MFILLLRGLKALFSKLTDNSEVFRDLFLEPREKRKTIKIILSGVCGAVYGLLLLQFILYAFRIRLGFFLTIGVHGSFVLFFGGFCAFSVQFRCILFLILLQASDKAGRNILKCLVLFYLLTGPISNILLNSKEVSRVSECSVQLTYNLTKNKLDLIVKPFIKAFSDVNFKEVRENFRQMSKVLGPVVDEVEGKPLKRFVYGSIFDCFSSKKEFFADKNVVAVRNFRISTQQTTNKN